MRLSAPFRFLAVLLCSSLVFSAPPRVSAPKVKEIVAEPRGWVKVAPAPADHEIELRIGLPQPNFPLLEQHLYEVSDPYHERYGAHLSKAEVEDLVAPHPESVNVIEEWLAAHGLGSTDLARSPAKDWVTINIPVHLAEKMLDTKYHVWKHIESGAHLIRTTSYSLPENVHAHVDVIQPTTMFALWKGLKTSLHYEDHTEEIAVAKSLPKINLASGVSVDPACNVSITINCLQQLYNIHYVPKATKKNKIGITGYLEQFANIQDLQSFYADQRPDALNSTFEFISVKGGLNNQTLEEAGLEANLDVQFAFGLSYPTPGTFWSTAGRPLFKPDILVPENTNEPYTDWLDYVLSHRDVPQSISTSYGDHEQTVPESYARRACASFAQLGARGVSLLFSSGDGGVGDSNTDPATQQCLTNDGRNITRFIPIFPAACPYVTAVGGTVNVPEIAVFFSGGGFSDYFSRPWYQDIAVESYLSKLPKDLYKGLWNRKGRAIPDVAAQGRRFRVFWKGGIISIGGTSASAPTFAAIVALLNDARLSKGLPTLGFLNPLLYTKGLSGFNDIVEGNNPGCGTPGFNAMKGWDPVTGLGTPDFGKLKKLLT
ncbi:Tripeptidyl-peptidase sed3 [Hypsizygus marmoreus]|uniref:tripeptidyl-peptidase II n=1 Tax=Hypsizygus marmoreus TaxID=39966 RepID=A0A369JFF8_HYPMA|nr:Tripeptidyl-peptidase sed3 [Hypsizygus marmoreus]